MTIYKYPFMLEDRFTISMPLGAKVLTAQMQRGIPCIWALVDEKAPQSPRQFYLYGAGYPMREAEIGVEYRATIQMHNGGLVLHLFELMPR